MRSAVQEQPFHPARVALELWRLIEAWGMESQVLKPETMGGRFWAPGCRLAESPAGLCWAGRCQPWRHHREKWHEQWEAPLKVSQLQKRSPYPNQMLSIFFSFLFLSGHLPSNLTHVHGRVRRQARTWPPGTAQRGCSQPWARKKNQRQGWAHNPKQHPERSQLEREKTWLVRAVEELKGIKFKRTKTWIGVIFCCGWLLLITGGWAPQRKEYIRPKNEYTHKTYLGLEENSCSPLLFLVQLKLNFEILMSL